MLGAGACGQLGFDEGCVGVSIDLSCSTALEVSLEHTLVPRVWNFRLNACRSDGSTLWSPAIMPVRQPGKRVLCPRKLGGVLVPLSVCARLTRQTIRGHGGFAHEYARRLSRSDRQSPAVAAAAAGAAGRASREGTVWTVCPGGGGGASVRCGDICDHRGLVVVCGAGCYPTRGIPQR